MSFERNPDHLADVHISFMKTALSFLHNENLSELNNVRMVVSPAQERDVIARTAIPKSKLVLIPVSNNIVVAEQHAAFLEAGVAFTHPARKVAMRAFISPIFAPGPIPDKDGKMPAKIIPEMLVPFWYVSTTPDPGDANVELQSRAVTIASKTVTVPVLVNHKAIPAGASAKLHKHSAALNKWCCGLSGLPEPPPAAPPAKRPRRS